MGWITTILNFLTSLFGILPKAATPEAKAETVGEAAGAAKEQARNATEGLSEIQRAQDARAAVDAAHPVADDSVRGNADGHAAPRGSDGIS